MEQPLAWVVCDGGPHLLIPQPLLKFWQGVEPPNPPRNISARFRFDPANPVACDYDRACEDLGNPGVRIVPVERGKPGMPDHPEVLGHALVVDVECMSSWCCEPGESGAIRIFDRLCAPRDAADEELRQAALRLPGSEFESTGMVLSAEQGPFVLMAACDSIDEQCPQGVYGLVPVPIHGGRYAVSTAVYRDDGTELFLVRLVPQSTA
jgi:hypothetical protein